MNLQNFLESGLLESYILGQCSAEERGIVEQMLAEHDMARKEKAAIEAALEQYAQARAIAPPGWMRGRILDQINMAPPAPQITASPAVSRWRNTGLWALTIAAGFAALMYYNANERVRQMESEKVQIEQQAQDCAKQRADARQAAAAQMAFLADTATRRNIKLDWVKKDMNAPGALAMSFDNPQQGLTYVQLMNLPALPDGQDYQLWVFVKGIDDPKELDVIRYEDSLMVKTDFRQTARAFAISIEKKGGSTTGKPGPVAMYGEI